MSRPRTVFFGSGAFALPTLEGLVDPGLVDLIAVVSAPARPAGRRGASRPTPVAEAARAHARPVLTPGSLRDVSTLGELVDLAPELIVLADYGRLIPAAVLELPRHGALNLHPSLLPRHRGATPVAAAIMAGDAVTGVTLMLMDEGLDTGPILTQRRVALDGTEVAPDLEARLAVTAAELLVGSLPAWLDGRLAARSQAHEGATLTRPLRRGDGRLDAERSAVELERQVRAYQPWPGSFLDVDGERLIVWRASVVPDDRAGLAVQGSGQVGDVVPSGDALALLTAAGALRLDEVQPAGGLRMRGPDHRRGLRR